MCTPGGNAPLTFRHVGRADADVLSRIPLDPHAVSRFLGSLDTVREVVRSGLAHVLIVAERGGEPIGFCVTHPDAMDGSTWWLGYLAVSARAQGAGVGRALLAHALRRLALVPGCRRVLLLCDRENPGARHLYGRMGFLPSGLPDQGSEEVLACNAGRAPLIGLPLPSLLVLPGRRPRLRLRVTPGPHAARAVAATRGPPSDLERYFNN
jgi:GNAT superfamily N-acetyltransferase